MGCDIHMYVEYKSKEDKDWWRPWGGCINPNRDYGMFSLLAGVRGEVGARLQLKPKGLPSTLGYEAEIDSRLFIVEEGEAVECEDCCSLECAKRWAAKYPECKIIYRDKKPYQVMNPDWHDYSWLTVQEFQQVIDNYDKTFADASCIHYKALLSAMQELHKGGYDVRVVFWFDN
jgi:hypothetical protein